MLQMLHNAFFESDIAYQITLWFILIGGPIIAIWSCYRWAWPDMIKKARAERAAREAQGRATH
jgi:hypothetical protein